MGHKKKRLHKYGRNPHNEPLTHRMLDSEFAATLPEQTPEVKTAEAVTAEKPKIDEIKPATMIAEVEPNKLLAEPETTTAKSIETTMFEETREESTEELAQKHEEVPMNADSAMKKKIKNLTAAVILLGGLLIGSLFVDAASLFSRDGLSALAVKENNVLTAGGKTWVAYADPKVNVKIITEESCEKCNPDQALIWLRRILPTLEAAPVEAGSDEGKKLIEDFGVKTLPAFVFEKEIVSTDFFTLAEQIFQEKNGSYILDTVQLGLEPGKYLKLPEIKDTDIRIGNLDAKVKVVEYSDFQCPYCRAFHPSVTKMLDEYGDRILFSYKHLPLSFHPQAENAALASECANEQGKFREYANQLFEKQSEWGNTTGTQAFKVIARQLGLKTTDFNTCLDEKKYLDKVNTNATEAAEFGVNGTPGIFVGDTFFAGAVAYEDIKAAIDKQLNK